MGTSAEVGALPTEPARTSMGEAAGGARVAGACGVASGALLVAKSVLEQGLGEPRGSAGELVRWATEHAVRLAWTNELLFFSAALLIPVVWALYAWLGAARRPWAAFACGLLAVSIPVVFVVGMALGRLVYPVYDIPVAEPHSVSAFAALYFGGSHEVALLLCGALVMTGIVMLASSPSWLGTLAIVAGLAQVAVSYPWLVGPDWTLVGQLLYAAWLVAVGLTLWRMRPLPVSETVR